MLKEAREKVCIAGTRKDIYYLVKLLLFFVVVAVDVVVVFVQVIPIISYVVCACIGRAYCSLVYSKKVDSIEKKMGGDDDDERRVFIQDIFIFRLCI